ncbi:hypothetical protein BC827DRAFT_1209480 [Russula dissimulans]|nr:hypothetical protein BC827DRAFT_1209480 [Russula dissimulans]
MSFDPLSILNLKFRSRTVAVFRNHCARYEDIIAVAQCNFRALQEVPAEDIILVATVPGYPETDKVELSKEIWPTVSGVVYSVTIALESELRTSTDQIVSPPAASSLPSSTPQRAPSQQSSDLAQTIKVTFPPPFRSAPAPFEISEPALLQKPVSHLHQIIETRVGYSPSNSRLIYLGTQLDNDLTLADYNVASGDSIVVTFRPIAPVRLLDEPDFQSRKVRKPVIYLYPPSSLLHVTVDLRLTSSWSFSAVYPSPRTTVPFEQHHPAQSLTWAITAEPDGTLVEKTTGAKVSYLYWEADASSRLVTPDSSRATTPVEDTEAFDPSRPSVNPGDSILLPIGRVAGYLDVALKALALHTEARTSFITYWLPDLLKYEYVALRFLPQASYERAAQMRVSPTPDVVTRVFMLFRGVAPGDLGLWEQAAARATAEDPDGATFWTQVVGVDAARASDRGLFRVLEWGGMEVC